VAGKVPVAFLAGFISVLTPCVLPLLPGYLSAVSAVEAGRLGERGMARRVAISSVPFIAGFSVVFVLVGAGAAALGGFVDAETREAIAGFVLVVLGLAFMGLLPMPTRMAAPGLLEGARRTGSAVLLGGAFAVCAAPCIGTVLASVVVLAGDADSVVRGGVVLFAYSLGLGLAFLAAGLAFTRAMGAFRWLRDHYRIIQLVSGAILVALGLLLFFNRDWWLRVAVERLLEALGFN
jgi:cytochrome c-type biogenesis protein